MAILSHDEAANILRTTTDDQTMLDLIPLVDGAILNATGRNWAEIVPIPAAAKNAARILLTRWHSDPGGYVVIVREGDPLQACFLQLEAQHQTLLEEESA